MIDQRTISEIARLRRAFLQRVYSSAITMRETISGPTPSNADKHSKVSVRYARGILERLDLPTSQQPVSEQQAGAKFELCVRDFVEDTFSVLRHLYVGKWQFQVRRSIEDFEQFKHLADVRTLLNLNEALRTVMGDYLVKPDVVVGRLPLLDVEINGERHIVSEGDPPRLSPMRAANRPPSTLILHASISCKLTFRSDRSQNSRTEALNIIRNRKGHTPHISVVTAEPWPNRLATLALGTGDIDCLYHIALDELQDAVSESADESSSEMLATMVKGNRLRDIADLPFDLLA